MRKIIYASLFLAPAGILFAQDSGADSDVLPPPMTKQRSAPALIAPAPLIQPLPSIALPSADRYAPPQLGKFGAMGIKPVFSPLPDPASAAQSSSSAKDDEDEEGFKNAYIRNKAWMKEREIDDAKAALHSEEIKYKTELDATGRKWAERGSEGLDTRARNIKRLDTRIRSLEKP
jgi:hypothetical protein